MSYIDIHNALKNLLDDESDFYKDLKAASSRLEEITRDIEIALKDVSIQSTINSKENEELIEFAVSNGWYPDFYTTSIPGSLELLRKYREKHIQQGEHVANAYFSSHFESMSESHLEMIYEKIDSKRKAIIKEAIKAHKLELYSLSAPVFLIQADGYTRHAYKQGIWGVGRKEDIISKSKRHHEMKKGELLKAILSPLVSKDTPILQSNYNRGKGIANDTIINRHSVIHGESCDYGTRENSMRAFSFLTYCILFIDSFWAGNTSEE